MDWLQTLATQNYSCPRCGKFPGQKCEVTNGMFVSTHTERLKKLSKEEMNSCAIQKTDMDKIFTDSPICS